MSLNRWSYSVAVGAMLVGLALPQTGQAEAQAPAQEPCERVIRTQGIGRVSVEPDSVRMHFLVEAQASDAEAARNAAAQRQQRLLQQLRGLNIPALELRTTSFSILPIREQQANREPQREPQPERIMGYRAISDIEARVEGVNAERLANHVSRMIDAGTRAGVDQITGPDFYLSQNSHAIEEALTQAMQQAQRHAQTVAEAAGVRLAGLCSAETYAQPIPFASAMERATPPMPRTPTPIEPGTVEVTANASVSYSFQSPR